MAFHTTFFRRSPWPNLGAGTNATRQELPGPWTVYAEGRGRYLPSKAAALDEIERLRNKGVTNIDVGCMQINLFHHGAEFDGLAQMLEPAANADYAARFLKRLHEESRAWSIAVAHYHSRTPEHADRYRRRVLKLWPVAARQVAALGNKPAPVTADRPDTGQTGAGQTGAGQPAQAAPTTPTVIASAMAQRTGTVPAFRIQRDTRPQSTAQSAANRPTIARGVYRGPNGQTLRIMSGRGPSAMLARTGGRVLAMPARNEG